MAASRAAVEIPLRYLLPGTFLSGAGAYNAVAGSPEGMGVGVGGRTWDALGYALFGREVSRGALAGGSAVGASTQPSTIVVHAGGRGGDISNGTLLMGGLAVCGVGAAALYLAGYGYEDVVWVTKRVFKETHTALSTSLNGLKEQLAQAKAALYARIGDVENRVDECRASVEAKVEAEVGAVRTDIASVGSKVDVVGRKQDEAADAVFRLEAQVGELDRKVCGVHSRLGRSEALQRQCTRGTVLLCKRVTTIGGRQDSEQRALEEFVLELDPSWAPKKLERSASTPLQRREIEAAKPPKAKIDPNSVLFSLMGASAEAACASGGDGLLTSGHGPECTT